MSFEPTKIDGVYVYRPRVFSDHRGEFFESYNQSVFTEVGFKNNFVQDNQSISGFGTIRGLHFQKDEWAQAKIIRVVSGVILDVAVDIRPGSETYGQHVAIELSAENRRQMLVPRGFAHGFSVLSETAVVVYKCDNFYRPSHDAGISFMDPDLSINWRVPTDKAIVSEKDQKLPRLKDLII